jgi:hypothetical protein
MKKIGFGLIFTLCMLACFGIVLAQNSLSVGQQESGITLSASIDQNNVPQNRNALLTVRLQWYGNLDKYEIHPFDNPIVHNFAITGTASANKVAVINGQKTAIRDYQFTLKPENMGMAYVENFIIKYTDLESNKDYALSTNRIEAKVIEPVEEPGSNSGIGLLIALLVLTAAAVAALLFLRRKKRERIKAEQDAAEKSRPIEEEFLSQLKNIDLANPDLKIANEFTNLTKILRHFLYEKFEISISASLQEIVQALTEKNSDDRFIHEVEEILNIADVVKFSGGSGAKSDLDRAYTLLETNLQKSLRGELLKQSGNSNITEN